MRWSVTLGELLFYMKDNINLFEYLSTSIYNGLVKFVVKISIKSITFYIKTRFVLHDNNHCVRDGRCMGGDIAYNFRISTKKTPSIGII